MKQSEMKLAVRTYRRHAKRFTELRLHDEANVMTEKADEYEAMLAKSEAA